MIFCDVVEVVGGVGDFLDLLGGFYSGVGDGYPEVGVFGVAVADWADVLRLL